MKHPHADSMLLYAQDAATTDKPWLGWEIRATGISWKPLSGNPMWDLYCEYRQKEERMMIGDMEVVRPISTTPTRQQLVCVVRCRHLAYPPAMEEWVGSNRQKEALRSGMLQRTIEDAIEHTHALIIISGGIL